MDINKISKTRKISNLKFNNLPILMGVLNITPDSFSDGGKFIKKVSARKQIDKLIFDGARIIDIGGESTRPGSTEILQTEEWLRLNKIMGYLKSRKFFVSLDTRKSFIMKKALKYNIDLINDVSGLSYDKETINFLKKTFRKAHVAKSHEIDGFGHGGIAKKTFPRPAGVEINDFDDF